MVVSKLKESVVIPHCQILTVHHYLKNSLKIHEENTKKITAVSVVYI